MEFTSLKNAVVKEQNEEEANFSKQIDAAISARNNSFLIQALLSNNAKLVELAHSRVHAFCERRTTLCYG
jgi:hypothetical protein